MQAAKAGHSTIGIPQSVGAEFVAATPKPSALPQVAPAEAENPAEDAAEQGVEEGPSEQYKYNHHKMMATKAPTLAARKMHKKLAAHHLNKIK
jgi:hypothetical protein